MELLRRFPLRELTTLKVGGEALYYCEPKSLKELKEAILFSQARDLPLFVMGRGSNAVVGEVKGLVVSTRRLKGLKVREVKGGYLVEALCGTSLSELHRLAMELSWEDFYRLYGFPASVGGAVAMNAGSFGAEVKDFLKKVWILRWEGELEEVPAEDLGLSYRSSPFPKEGLVVKALFFFKKGSRPVRELYAQVAKKRKEKQPLNLPTSGSAFKNPPLAPAGKLLEEAGLKGFRLGGVGFSEKHANFLVNYGGGTFREVKELLSIAKEKVDALTGVKLEEEVRLVEDSGADGWKVL